MTDQAQPVQPPPVQPSPPKSGTSARGGYHLVTDTITGPNVRLKDNLYQGLAILVCLALGAVVGGFVPVEERAMSIGIGAFIGLLVGLIGSGIFIMIYRALKHITGEHD